jgi:hypothetical protein
MARSAGKLIEAGEPESCQPQYRETKFEIPTKQIREVAQLMTEPEQTLWTSVLTLAMQDITGPDHIAKPARAWFSSRNTSLGSLIWICDQLGLDPNAVRQKVLRRRASELSVRDRSQDQAA